MFDFDSVSDNELIKWVHKDGVFLTVKVKLNCLIELYAVDNLFIEVSYCHYNNDVIRTTTVHKNSEFIDDYINDKLSFGILKSL